MFTVTHKIPGGKLLRLKSGLKDGKLQAPQLSGDFFLMPPEGVSTLEEALEGMPAVEHDAIVETLTYVIERDSIRLSGISPEDIADAAGRLEEQ